ncbi:MAG: DHA2 family efflux MFS transporter permease subunit [Chloroflexota bacterium]
MKKSARSTLIAAIFASGIIFLDSSIVKIALPAIDARLDAGLAGLQWIVNAYVLALASLLLLGGALGDRYGRRRMMIVGLIGFGAASIACGLAPSTAWLIAARAGQGAAGALVRPGSLALLRANFGEGEARGTAIGRWAGWAGVATLIGPVLGGWLVGGFSWRWIFFVNLPPVALTIWMLAKYVPESQAPPEKARAVDWPGTLLATCGLAGLTYGLIEGPLSGWGGAGVLTGLIGGVLALAAFIFIESRATAPMLPLHLFRSRNFSIANVSILGVYFAVYGTTFFLVIYLQNVMGYSALQAGLVLVPIALLMIVFSPVFGRLAARTGPRLWISLGPLAMALGLILFARLQPHSNFYTHLLPAVLVFGLGKASTIAPLNDTVLSTVPDRYAGVASAVANAVSRAGVLLAVALLGGIVATTYRRSLAQRTAGMALSAGQVRALEASASDLTGTLDVSAFPPRVGRAINQAYTQALHRAMTASAAVAAAGGLAAALWIRNPARCVEQQARTAQREAPPALPAGRRTNRLPRSRCPKEETEYS